MAIINCPECGNPISDKANKCIHCGKIFEEITIEELICEECGNPIPESSKECPNCGCPVHVKPKFKFDFKSKFKFKLTKKVRIIICLIIGFVIVACVGSAIYNSDPVQNHIAEVEANKAALEASEKAFKEAQAAENNNDYELAIKKYKAVIKEDASYEEARNKITELREIYKNQLLSEAENYAQNKSYKEAIQKVDKVISTFGSSDELTELKEMYTDLKASQYAKIVVTDKTSIPKDTSKWLFNNYVNFVFDVTNNSNKAIKGIEGVLTINDLFGKEIISVGCDFTGQTIEVGETVTVGDLSFECNEFIDSHMKLFNTDFSDMQFVYDISNIVYTDGTTVVPE